MRRINREYYYVMLVAVFMFINAATLGNLDKNTGVHLAFMSVVLVIIVFVKDRLMKK